MAKISTLPTAGALTGAERLPLLQDGETREVGAQAILDAAVEQTFNVIRSKNLYDPGLAVDAHIWNYGNGTLAAFANGMITGRMPVEEGKTYTLSQPAPEKGFFPHLYCWDADGDYLGMDALLGGDNPVIAGMDLVTSGAGGTGGFRRVTFTVPEGSGIRSVGTMALYNYAAHTTADFDRIRNAVQLEEGALPTAFEPWGTQPVIALKDSIVLPASVTATVDAFDFGPSKNRYDLTGAENGRLLGLATGTSDVYANGIVLGWTAVEPGKTYTASMTHPLGLHNAHSIYCRDAGGEFLGLDHTVGAYVGMAEPPTDIVWTGDAKVTFTIPADSDIRFVGFMTNYSVHTVDDFNAVVASVQIEEGTEATAWSPYSATPVAKIRTSALPEVLSTGATAALPLRVRLTAADVYIGATWDDDELLWQKVTLSTGVAFTNDTVNVMGARRSLRTVLDATTAWATGVVLANQGDDSAPLHYFNTYIGANHGPNFVLQIVAAGHGKTVLDVGSDWTDGVGLHWCILRVVDADTLWVLSENLSVYPAWSFAVAISGTVLTHAADATNVAAINITGAVTVRQLTPCLQSQSKKVLLDGRELVTAPGDYACSTLHIVNAYNITNPASVRDYVRSQAGGATQPSFIHESIEADVRRTITYAYAENGSCTIIDDVRLLNPVLLNASGYFSGTQAMPLTYTGKELWEYIPRLLPFVGGLKTWDFANQENIGGAFELVQFDRDHWAEADNPPDRMAQMVKSGGAVEFGLMVGISRLRSVGDPAQRVNLVNQPMFLSANRKQYPAWLSADCTAYPGPVSMVPAGASFQAVAFRAWWRGADNPEATCVTWYRDGRSVIVIADFHDDVAFSALRLPPQFTGMDIEVLDKTDTLTIHGSGIVAPDGVFISTALAGAPHASVILRLT